MVLVTMDSGSAMQGALHHCLTVQELDWTTSAALDRHGGHAWHPGKAVSCLASAARVRRS